ncbi:MAG: hypothetical protein E7588_02455 [Ruminococcaceae bacterium]|nr:hypothetical protein [Oscillospiraceae bacterium]
MAYTLQKKIYSYELCHNGTIKPSYLMRYMQTVAGLDSDSFGATYKLLREHDMVFIITKLKLEMFDKVKTGDIIDIKSWQKEIKGVTFIRDYEISCGDNVVGYASAQWALMSFSRRSPVRPSQLPVPVAGNPEIPARDVELERRIVHPDEAAFCGTFSRKVMLSDLDENMHLNNTNYADIMLDFIPRGIGADYFKLLQINFRGEALLDDELEVSVYSFGKEVYYYAENLTKGHTCFEGKFVLE